MSYILLLLHQHLKPNSKSNTKPTLHQALQRIPQQIQQINIGKRWGISFFSVLSGVFSLSMCILPPADAQNATASSVATFTSSSVTLETFDAAGNLQTRSITSGATSSIAAEMSLPQGMYFAGSATSTPTYGTLANGTTVLTSLSMNPGIPTVVPVNASFNRTAAQILQDAATNPNSRTDIEELVSLIRAGAGVNGLD